MRALDQARYIGRDERPFGPGLNRSEVRVLGGERIVGDLRVSARDS